jgi:hypothetical protein
MDIHQSTKAYEGQGRLHGKTIGTRSENPIMNSIVYEVELLDGGSNERQVPYDKVWPEDYPRLEFSCELEGWDRVLGELAELKDSYPNELAECAKALGIADEPAFAWWAPHTLRRRNVILSAVRAKVWKKTYKYGIEVPTSLVRAKELDRIIMLSSWRSTMLELPLRSLRMAKVHRRDGRRQVATLSGT